MLLLYYVKFLLVLFYCTSVFLVKGQLVFRLRLSSGIFVFEDETFKTTPTCTHPENG